MADPLFRDPHRVRARARARARARISVGCVRRSWVGAILVVTTTENRNKKQDIKTTKELSEAASQRPSHHDDLRRQLTRFLASPSPQKFLRGLAYQTSTMQHHALLQHLSNLTHRSATSNPPTTSTQPFHHQSRSDFPRHPSGANYGEIVPDLHSVVSSQQTSLREDDWVLWPPAILGSQQ
jgi:hypothetical protein